MRRAYATWLRPPAIELYDLEADPHELTNPGADPGHAGVRARLLAEIASVREAIGDPFLDPGVLTEFVEAQAAAQDLAYRKNPDFEWGYVEAFRERRR